MKIETIDAALALALASDGDGDGSSAGTVSADGGNRGNGGDGEDGEHQSDPHTPSQYRKAQGLPPELKEHCRVYLEEALRMLLRPCPVLAPSLPEPDTISHGNLPVTLCL